MPDICLGFEVHQPLRINRNFQEDSEKDIEDLFELYFDNEWNKKILNRVAKKCYLPSNEIILENIDKFSEGNRNFKVTFSISGVLAWQCEKWYPEVLESFKKLAETEYVEFLNQTFHHSLASLYSPKKEEFIEQVEMHKELIKNLFGQEPRVFENTEFIYNNSIAKTLENMGYEGVFTEGVERILGWRSPNYVYKARDSGIKVFMRNYRLSDDIGFRFTNTDWPEHPLTADKYATWLSKTSGQCTNIFVDYETFGEHHWPESGIHDFLSWLPEEVLKYQNNRFVTPSELLEKEAVDEIHVSELDSISWADESRSTNAWLGNSMQRECYRRIKKLEPKVKEIGDEEILEIWRFLQTSDLIYYMFTTPGSPKEVHDYFSQQSPYEAYRLLSRILTDFEKRIDEIR